MSEWEVTRSDHERRIIPLTKSAGSISMFDLFAYCTRCAWSEQGDRMEIARAWIEHIKAT